MQLKDIMLNGISHMQIQKKNACSPYMYKLKFINKESCEESFKQTMRTKYKKEMPVFINSAINTAL